MDFQDNVNYGLWSVSTMTAKLLTGVDGCTSSGENESVHCGLECVDCRLEVLPCKQRFHV